MRTPMAGSLPLWPGAEAWRGGWVEVYKLEEDGTLTTRRYEGGSEEAERLREEALKQGPAF